MYIDKEFLREVFRQIKDEQINLILEQPTARDIKIFDTYKFGNELFYNKKQVDDYLLKHIRNVFDTLGIE
jgi:hypothetical protein